MHIDGIIGWNPLQNFSVNINYKTQMFSLAQSLPKIDTAPNFFWMTKPIIICEDSLNTPLNFIFDSGSSSPAEALHPYYTKADTTKTYTQKQMVGSAGGFMIIKSLIFPTVLLKVANKQLNFHNVPLSTLNEKDTFHCDGILGSTAFKNYSVLFDLNKGIFKLE